MKQKLNLKVEKLFGFLLSFFKIDINKEICIEKIRSFVLKVNKIACRIEFSASYEKFQTPIWELSNLIDSWNKDYFSLFGFKIELIMLQVNYFSKKSIIPFYFKIPKEKYSNYENIITLLENKKQENFKKFIREVHTIKSEYSLYDVRIGLFCLHWETEDKNFYPTHRRISFMIDEEDKECFQKFSTNNIDTEDNDIIQYKFYLLFL